MKLNPSFETHLRALLGQLWTVLEVQVRRMQRAGLLAPPEVDPHLGAITPREIEARLALRGGRRQRLPPLGPEDLEQLRHAQAALIAAHSARDGERGLPPFERLVSAFGLDEAARLVLLMTIAQELDPEFSRLYGYLNDHYGRQYPTLSLLSDLLSSEQERFRPSELIGPEAPLTRWHLVRLAPMPAEVPTLQRPLVVEERVLRYVRGATGLDVQLAPYATLWPKSAPNIAPFFVTGPAQTVWDQAAEVVENAQLNGRLPRVVLRGPAGIGKRRWAYEVARALERPMLVVDLAAMSGGQAAFPELMRAVVREAQLHDALLCLLQWESLVHARPVTLDPEGHQQAAPPDRPHLGPSRALARGLSDFQGALVVAIEDAIAPQPDLGAPLDEFAIPLPDRVMSDAFWHLHLPGFAREHGVHNDALIEAFRLTPGQIAQASLQAQRLAGRHLRTDARVGAHHLSAAVNEIVQHRLGETATLVERRYGLKDLVTTPEVQLELREIVERYRQKRRVLDEWNFGARFGRELGLSVLFDGPPGTGKTMAASVVAGELGLELYQIDLSRVVSKWIGETEKNLGRVFDEAERSRAVLLFDEADSLFSKRTSVQSSNDRYANLEVNYLLQRVERFTGIAILTTNFVESIDSAFMRRIAMRVSFLAPGPAERKRLWESMLRAGHAPLGPIDFDHLARTYELAGGLVRNAVLRAAFAAAEHNTVIDQELLEQCARVEMKKAGHVVRGATR